MNPLHPTVPVEIDGHQFTLRYEYRDYAKAEGRLRMALVGPKGLTDFWSAEGEAYKVAVLLYVGLLNCETRVQKALGITAPLTLDDVFGLITFETAPQIEQAVAEALETFMPQAKDKGEAKAETPLAAETNDPATTGTKSTPSLVPPSA